MGLALSKYLGCVLLLRVNFKVSSASSARGAHVDMGGYERLSSAKDIMKNTRGLRVG